MIKQIINTGRVLHILRQEMTLSVTAIVNSDVAIARLSGFLSCKIQ